MVYSFMFGLFIGLPIGCYLRETGYARKFNTAYNIFFPDKNEHKSDQFRNRSKEFFDNLKKGQVDNTDFERYIYGAQFNKRTSDE